MSQQDQDPFKKYIGYSLVAHVAVFLAFTVKAYLLPSEPIQVMSSIKVDVVGLPEKAKPQKAKPAAKPKPKPEPKPKPKPKPKAKPKPKPKPKPAPKPKPKPKVDLEKTKSSQQKAMEKLKAMDALEKMKQEVESQKQAEAEAEAEEVEPQEIKGNVITSGSSLSGLDRIAFERYYDDMSSHIKAHWSLPSWLSGSNLKAEAAVTIDDRGYVTSKQIHKSSGNQVFDDLVLETVEKASPFPAPPPRLQSVLALKGMILGFPK